MESAPITGESPPEPDRSGAAAEIALSGGLSALLFAAFFALPFAGALGLPFAAAPAVRVAHRRGFGAGLAASGLAAAVLFALGAAAGGARGGAGVGLAVGVLAMLPVVSAAAVRRGADPSRAYLALCVAGAAVFIGLLLGVNPAGDRPVGAELSEAFDRMMPGALESYRKANADAVTLERVRSTLIAARDFTRRYWPGLVGACWVLEAAVAFYAGARAARPAPSAARVRFESLAVPPAIAGVFVASGAAFAFSGGVLRTAAGALLLTLAALYFVAGLSIICHFARRWFRARILRFGLYVLVAYFPMNIGVALLGLFDWYAHFRRRGERV
jgi:Predicted membrane protein (DUF2232)